MDIPGKYSLLVIRSKYLNSTLGASETIFSKAYVEFTKSLRKRLGSPAIPKEKKEEKKKEENNQNPPSQMNHENPEDRIEIKKEEKDQNLKQVFRKIALEVHPDKLENKSDFEKKYKTSLFEKARKSFETNDYYGIVQVAEELGIDPPPPTKKQIELMKNKNQQLENKINDIKNSAVWSWYHAEDDAKELIMERYIETLKQNRPRA